MNITTLNEMTIREKIKHLQFKLENLWKKDDKGQFIVQFYKNVDVTNWGKGQTLPDPNAEKRSLRKRQERRIKAMLATKPFVNELAKISEEKRILAEKKAKEEAAKLDPVKETDSEEPKVEAQ